MDLELEREMKVLGENSPTLILSTTNPTSTEPALNLSHQGKKSTTNHLSYGTATFMD
jgi:hypothetical protein